MPEIGALSFQQALSLGNIDLRNSRMSRQSEMRGGARRLPHDETTTTHARGRMALTRHRCTATGDQQIVRPLWQHHAIWQVVKAARLRNWRPRPFDIAGDMLLQRPGIDADGVIKARTVQHILAAELIGADDPPRFANA